MPNLIGLTLDQAVTRLPEKMRIGGDEVGDKPPTPEQAFRIFAQQPAPGTKVDTDKEVVVTVKRYGSGRTASADDTAATGGGDGATGTASGNFEGEWEGTTGSGSAATRIKVVIKREGGSYGVWVDGEKVPRIQMEKGELFYYETLSMAIVPFTGYAERTEPKEDDPGRFKIILSVSGDQLNIDFSDPKGTKRARQGTLARKRAANYDYSDKVKKTNAADAKRFENQFKPRRP
jgi:hypothetical protein